MRAEGAAPRNACAAVLAGALLAACARGPSAPRGPVLLVSVDTLPANRVGCYGDPRARTPSLDRLARGGLQVVDVVSPAPLTLPSHATMLTGVDPPAHGVRDNGLYRLPESTPTVAERLPPGTAAAGFLGGFPLYRTFGLGRGFSVWDDAGLADAGALRHPQRRAADVLASARKWLALRARDRAPFAFIHLYDPHYPYEAPPRWAAAVRAGGGDDYDAEVAYVDAQLARFVAWVDETLPPPALLLVTADHGESLGAHGEPTHANFVYDETQRVPLVLGGARAPHRLETRQRRLADVAATILDAYGVGAAGRGASLLRPAAGDSPAYVETMHTKIFKGWAPLFGARTERWKYIRAPRPELYDLRADPAETRNLLAERADVVAALSAFVDSALAGAEDRPEPGLTDDARARLAALGYVAAAPPSVGAAEAAKDPKDGIASTAALFWGEQAFLHGDLAEAEARLVEAANADPSLKDAYAYLAGVRLRTARPALAIRDAERALALEPHVNEAPLHATLGEAYLDLGRLDDAARHLEIASGASPKDARLAALLARARRR
jgi:hypothetical protein